MLSASLPSGFRDMSPKAFAELTYIIQTAKARFKQHGFLPLKTPAMEHLATLMGKYGDAGEALLFKVLNSGNALESLSPADLEVPTTQSLSKISKRALRYDLTVPLARYVAQNRHQLHFPFKRYQIQPVWRADRPQKGRYREFYQCDVDIVHSASPFSDASLLVLAYEIFTDLEITDFTIYLNHRQWLDALAHHSGMASSADFFYQTLDKLDKIGSEAVLELLQTRGLQQAGKAFLKKLLTCKLQPGAGLQPLQTILPRSQASLASLDTLAEVLSYVRQLNPKAYAHIIVDPTLARGISYYSGPIFEIRIAQTSIGSVAGGGRYDRLTEMFGIDNMPSVGISFGLERIYDIMKQHTLFPKNLEHSVQLLLVPMEPKLESQTIQHLVQLRTQGIVVEFYPAGTRLKKAFSYADKKGIPWVGILGTQESKTNTISLKNMHSGQQKSCKLAELMALLQAKKL